MQSSPSELTTTAPWNERAREVCATFINKYYTIATNAHRAPHQLHKFYGEDSQCTRASGQNQGSGSVTVKGKQNIEKLLSSGKQLVPQQDQDVKGKQHIEKLLGSEKPLGSKQQQQQQHSRLDEGDKAAKSVSFVFASVHIKSLDFQCTQQNLDSKIFLVVCGEVLPPLTDVSDSHAVDPPPPQFSQTFLLAAVPSSDAQSTTVTYYIQNDVLRFQDDNFHSFHTIYTPIEHHTEPAQNGTSAPTPNRPTQPAAVREKKQDTNKLQNGATATLFVGNIPRSVTADKLKKEFEARLADSKGGKLPLVRIALKTGFAFAEFPSAQISQQVLDKIHQNPLILDGTQLTVRFKDDAQRGGGRGDSQRGGRGGSERYRGRGAHHH